jgi:uncharacterized protein YbbK (DUF523 family)
MCPDRYHGYVIRILVSACLLGEPVRYDGGTNRVEHPALARWRREGRLVPVCPEVEGGLGVPRPPAESRGAAVLTRGGHDVTAHFAAGAGRALALAREYGARIAILKERSPSCGVHQVHDGTFSGRLVPGAGVTAALLRENDIAVFSEDEIGQADFLLEVLEAANLGQ